MANEYENKIMERLSEVDEEAYFLVLNLFDEFDRLISFIQDIKYLAFDAIEEREDFKTKTLKDIVEKIDEEIIMGRKK